MERIKELIAFLREKADALEENIQDEEILSVLKNDISDIAIVSTFIDMAKEFINR